MAVVLGERGGLRSLVTRGKGGGGGSEPFFATRPGAVGEKKEGLGTGFQAAYSALGKGKGNLSFRLVITCARRKFRRAFFLLSVSDPGKGKKGENRKTFYSFLTPRGKEEGKDGLTGRARTERKKKERGGEVFVYLPLL